jgi:nucleoside phosphorylase
MSALDKLRYLRNLVADEPKAQHRALMMQDFRARAKTLRPDLSEYIDAVVQASAYLQASRLASLLDMFIKTVRETDSPAEVDLLIVVPKTIELIAAQVVLGRKLGEVTETPHPSGRHVFSGVLSSAVSQRDLTYKLICLNRQTNVAASVAISDILHIAPARFAVLIGMAAGHPEKVSPPDVVAAESVLYVTPGTRLDRADIPDPQPLTMPPRIAEDLGAARPQFHGWQELYTQSISSARHFGLSLPSGENADRLPEFKPGVLLSVEQKIEVTNIGSFMERFSGDAKALDMEAGGFGAVCHSRGVDWAVFRGVSDFGRLVDEKGIAVARDKSWQLSAALAAVTAFVVWITRQSTIYSSSEVPSP